MPDVTMVQYHTQVNDRAELAARIREREGEGKERDERWQPFRFWHSCFPLVTQPFNPFSHRLQ